jgi:hypothetical protein
VGQLKQLCDERKVSLGSGYRYRSSHLLGNPIECSSPASALREVRSLNCFKIFLGSSPGLDTTTLSVCGRVVLGQFDPAYIVRGSPLLNDPLVHQRDCWPTIATDAFCGLGELLLYF